MAYHSLSLATPIIDCPRNQLITAARPAASGRMMNAPRGAYPRRSSPTNRAKPVDEGANSGGDQQRRSAGSSSASLRTPTGQTIQRLQCFKTKKCRFWMEGRCNRGEACTYAHTEVELREPPDLTKTKLCTRWKKGACDKNAHECAYAHGLDDLRDSMTPSTATSRLSNGGNDLGFSDEDDEDDRDAFYSVDPAHGDSTKDAAQDEENFGGTDKNTAATTTDDGEETDSDGLPSRLLLSPTTNANDEELNELENEIMLQSSGKSRKDENDDDDNGDDEDEEESSLGSLYPVHSGITTDVPLSLLGSVSAGSQDVGVVDNNSVLGTGEELCKKKDFCKTPLVGETDCMTTYWCQSSGNYMASIEGYFD